MIPILVELSLLAVVAIAGWFGAEWAVQGTLAAAAARAQEGDAAAVLAAGRAAGGWFAGGIGILLVTRAATSFRRGQHIRTPLLLPAAAAAAGLGLVVQLGYGNPFLANWPGPGFATGVFYGCVVSAILLALPGDIGAWISRGRWVIGGVALALLVALALFGDAPGSSGQRINLFGTQPIELVKVGAALFAADALGRRASKIRYQRVRAGWLRLPRATLLLPALAALAATWAGMFLVRDLGPTLILGVVFLALFYLATRSPGWVLLALGTVATSLAILGSAPGLAPAGNVETRLRMWADPWLNGLPNGDQLALARWAMAAGGWEGSGLGTGFPGGIPAGHTDLVYAHLVEELGVVGGFAYLACLAIAITDGLRVAARNRTPERAMMAAALAVLVIAQAGTILGGTFGLIPLTGVVVPLLSYGKTSMVAFLAVVALIARLGEDGEARVATDELRELAAGVRHVQVAVAALAVVGVVATLWAAVHDRDATTLRGVVTTQADGTAVLLHDRRLTSIASQIRRGDIRDRNGELLATSPIARTRELPLGDALGTLLGPADGGLLRARWSVERQQESVLRGYPDLPDGPALWLGPPREPGGREQLVLAVASAAETSTDEALRARRAWRERTGSDAGSEKLRRVPLAAPDLSSILPLARLPLAQRQAAVSALSANVAPRSVTLTLDARLTRTLAPAVRTAAAKSKVGAAALAVIDTRTGQVLARVQWPDYDPSGTDWRARRLAEDPRFMGVYGAWSDKTGAHGVWQAGSVFKVLSALAAAKVGKVTADAPPDATGALTCPTASSPRFACDQVHDGRPSFTLPGWKKPIHDHGDGGARGRLDLVQALTRSSNVWFGQLALALGPEPYRALRAQGVEFGNPGLDQELDADFTGLGAPGSRRLAQTGFGQGAGSWNVTQAARLVAAVADGGVYRRCPPDLLLDAPCTAVPLLEDASGIAPILSGMRGVMSSGTGARLPKVPGVRIYGKTGTADAPGTRDEAPWNIRPGQETSPHSWFVAIAEPDTTAACATSSSGRYAIAAVVPHGGFGATAAGPLAIEAVRALVEAGYLRSAAASTR